jgi:phage antirepressor YoqD-like protein
MSSREIAELTGKRHGDVIRDIRVMLYALAGDDAELRHVHEAQDARGYTARFDLPKGLTITLVSGYSVQMRRRIVARWMELEAQQQTAPILPRSFAEALRLAADQAEQLEAQRLQLEHQRPAVEFVDRFVDSAGLMGVRQVAKLLKANEREFVAWLEQRGVMYRLAGRLTPMANHMDAGRFEVKTGAADNGHAFTSARFTPKGVEWIAGEWGKRMALAEMGGVAA